MNANAELPQANFMIQKIFIRDTSFESPQAPLIFKNKWQPEANIEINTDANKVDEDLYEVTLTVTVTAKTEGQTAFLVEVKQSGIFTINGIPENQMGHLLGSFCPSILFPYAREAIGNLVSRGGFPELSLAPINFDMLYAQQQAQQAQQNEKKIITH
jgi:preprotein translocase subunit SecB